MAAPKAKAPKIKPGGRDAAKERQAAAQTVFRVTATGSDLDFTIAPNNLPVRLRREMRAQIGKSQRVIGQKVAGWSRFAASGMGGPFAHFAGAIRGGGGVTGAKVSIGDPAANAAFWGAKKHTGWYADPRYNDSAAQHPDWVGNTWDAWSGQGPYAIAPTIAGRADWIVKEYGEAIDQITADAFDYRTSTF